MLYLEFQKVRAVRDLGDPLIQCFFLIAEAQRGKSQL